MLQGLGLTKASQMIELLEPLVGSLATSIFAVGIIAAGVSSQFPNVLMLPWLLCDYNQSERKMTLPRYPHHGIDHFTLGFGGANF